MTHRCTAINSNFNDSTNGNSQFFLRKLALLEQRQWCLASSNKWFSFKYKHTWVHKTKINFQFYTSHRTNGIIKKSKTKHQNIEYTQRVCVCEYDGVRHTLTERRNNTDTHSRRLRHRYHSWTLGWSSIVFSFTWIGWYSVSNGIDTGLIVRMKIIWTFIWCWLLMNSSTDAIEIRWTIWIISVQIRRQS